MRSSAIETCDLSTDLPMHINRANLTKRLGLLIAGLSAVCTLQALAACGTPGTSLKQAYAQGFLLGTAVNADIVSGKDAASAALAACHFNAVTAKT